MWHGTTTPSLTYCPSSCSPSRRDSRISRTLARYFLRPSNILILASIRAIAALASAMSLSVFATSSARSPDSICSKGVFLGADALTARARRERSPGRLTSFLHLPLVTVSPDRRDGRIVVLVSPGRGGVEPQRAAPPLAVSRRPSRVSQMKRDPQDEQIMQTWHPGFPPPTLAGAAYHALTYSGRISPPQ